MATIYSSNFDDGQAGTLPAGWASMSGGWVAKAAAGVSGTLGLGPTENADGVIIVNRNAQTADGAMTYRMRYQSRTICSPVFRCDASFQNGYVIAVNPATNSAMLFTRTNGNFAPQAAVNGVYPANLADGDFLNLEVQFIGRAIQLRMWEEGSARPGAPNAAWDHGAFLISGFTGVYQSNEAGIAANGFDDYAVADTNVTPTPTPTPAPSTRRIAPNDAAIVYSPGNWTGADATSNASINAGAYSRVMFSGSIATLSFDVSVAQAPLSQIAYRVDGKEWVVAPIASTITVTMPADTTAAAFHTLEWLVKSTSETIARWAAASATAVIFTGLTIADGATVRRPREYKYAILIFGDSITEGVRTINETASVDTDRNDSRTGWALELGARLGVEVGVIGFGRQGWVIGGNGGVPTLPSSVGFLKQGVARTFPSNVVAVIVNMGTNDNGYADGDVSSAVTSFLTTTLAATTASIVLLRPFNGAKAGAIQAGIAAKGSGRVYYVDTDGVLDGSYGIDSVGLHPNGPNNIARIAPALADKLRQYAQPRRFTMTAA